MDNLLFFFYENLKERIDVGIKVIFGLMKWLFRDEFVVFLGILSGIDGKISSLGKYIRNY